MTFPNKEQQAEAKRMIAQHDATNFYTFQQRLELLGQSDNGMVLMPNHLCPMQVGDTLCALDNNRIPFEFDPKTSARLVRNKDFARSFEHHGTFKPRIGLEDREPTVDDNVRELILRIMEEGVDDTSRTGIRTRAVNSVMHTYDISHGEVPAVSTKYNWNFGVKVELVWMISGDTNIRFLKQRKVNIWDAWVKPGTEEYHYLTEKEIQDALVKHYGETHNLSFEVAKVEETADEPLRNGNYEIGEYGQDEGKEQLLILTYDIQGLQQCYREVLGQEPRRLVGGELPKIYQHQWRGWEDTRVVCDEEVEAYEAREFTDLGPLDADYLDRGYGGSVVVHRKIDQLTKVIDQLKNKPDDRGIILSAWNVAELDEMALRPCHTLCQFFSKPMSVRERLEWLGTYKPAGFEHLSEEVLRRATAHDDRRHEAQFKNDPKLGELLEAAKVPTRKLSSTLYMRSNDVGIGHTFNIVQYAMLTHMVAQVTGHATDTFTYMGGDAHIYENQWPAVLQWLDQDAQPGSHPTIRLNPNVKDLFDFKVEDIEIVGYVPGPRIKFPEAAV